MSLHIPGEVQRFRADRCSAMVFRKGAGPPVGVSSGLPLPGGTLPRQPALAAASATLPGWRVVWWGLTCRKTAGVYFSSQLRGAVEASFAEGTLRIPAQLCTQRCRIGTLNLVVVGIVTPGNWQMLPTEGVLCACTCGLLVQEANCKPFTSMPRVVRVSYIFLETCPAHLSFHTCCAYIFLFI